MSWAHAFIPVPTDWLDVDRNDVSPTPKADPAQMRQWMGTVPELYRLQAQGWTDADFRRLAEAPRNEHEKLLGETHRHLFSDSPSAQPLRADFIDGRGLVVQSGQHRVLSAQETRVPAVPVHVAVADPQQLQKLRDACDEQVRTLGPDYERSPEIHQARETREAVPDRGTDQSVWGRHIPGERLEPERERYWSRPERER